jgi:Tol biopolymer transport system component
VASRPKAALEGVRLDPAEAVAITLELAKQISSGEISGAPQDAAAVELADGGQPTVDVDRLDGASPGVLAGLLHSLLTTGGERPVPGALMLTIARARGEIDLAGFPTIDAFVTALSRFAPADPRQTLAALYDRLAPPIPEEEFADSVVAAASPAADVVIRFESGTPGLASAASEPVTPPDYEPIVVTEDAEPAGGFSFTRIFGSAALIALFFAAGWFATSLYYGRGPRMAAPAPAAPRDTAPPPAASNPARDERVGTTGPVPPRDTGSTPVKVASAIEGAYSPSFAPSGEALYFHTRRGAPSALVRASSGDGDTQLLRIVDDDSSNFHVRPSPDGKSIAFDSNRDGERGVYVSRADGSDVRRVSGEGHAAVPSWSPDGQWLAFVRAEPERARTWNVWLLNLSTNEQRQVTTFTYGQPWGASWFPDGQRIAYSHEDRLIVRDLTTGATRVFQSPEPDRLVRTPAVSPDGTRIIYQVDRDGVWLLDVRDGSARRLLDDPTAEEFAWDPEGRRIAFHSKRGGGWSIFVMAAGS